jgi:hypothetical protein
MNTTRALLCLASLALSTQVYAADTAAPHNPHAGMTMGTNPHAGMSLSGSASAELTQQGVVLTAIDVPQYTYIEVRQGKDSHWLATTTVAVKKGDVIRFGDGMMMSNFYSKSLKRTFDKIAFVSMVRVSNAKK